MFRVLLVLAALVSLALCTTSACTCGDCDVRREGDPLVKTLPATDIMTVGTTLNGSLEDMGDSSSVEVWFVCTALSEYHETPKQTMTATGEFSATLGPLMIGKTYEFHAEAKGDSGARFTGGTLTFYVP